MVYLLIALIALGIGVGFTISYFRPRLKRFIYEDEAAYKKNCKLEAENKALEKECRSLDEQKTKAIRQLNELKVNIGELEIQANEASNLFYKQKMASAQARFDKDSKVELEKFEATKAQYAEALLQTMKEGAEEFKTTTAKQEKYCAELREEERQLRNTVEAAVAAAKRAEEIKIQADFYKLQLSQKDIEEIQMLRKITPYLRDQEPLNKVIWKVYYEKPTTDLIGRVIGSGAHTGIYKITNLENDKCYVGQAANLADRWKQHIKRGIGAETPTRNKLYPAMLAIGVENFSFEVIEECSRDLLDAREDYWQDFFKAKEFGYSIK